MVTIIFDNIKLEIQSNTWCFSYSANQEYLWGQAFSCYAGVEHWGNSFMFNPFYLEIVEYFFFSCPRWHFSAVGQQGTGAPSQLMNVNMSELEPLGSWSVTPPQ